MIIYYEYLEPKRVWTARGYAKNLVLEINFNRKTYKICEHYTLLQNFSGNVAEVKTKSNIKTLMNYFVHKGFAKDEGSNI